MATIPAASSRAGFTLLELLVALAVFAVMSAMAYGGLASMLETRRAVAERSEELARLQMTFGRMAADIEQSLDRPTIEGEDAMGAAMAGGDGLDFFLELTRGGWANPRGVARSALQRVAYSVDDETIKRYSWQTLDRLSEEEPQAVSLVDGVLYVTIRFLDQALVWHSFWPPDTDKKQPKALSSAIEITIEKKGWGRIRRVFEVAGKG